jgi:hypothetical protein
MVDKGGEWTFGRWYDAEPTAVKTFKGWETCGNVAEMTVSARRRRQSHGGGNSVGGGGSARGKLRALRSEQVNLNHCFRGTASAATTATATLQPPCQSGGSVPGVLARGESTFASRHFSQLRLQRLQAAANELDRLDALAESMSLAKDHVRPAGVRGGDLRMSPVKRRRKLKRYLPFDKPERAETRSERALERAVDARQTLSTAAAAAAAAPDAATKRTTRDGTRWAGVCRLAPGAGGGGQRGSGRLRLTGRTSRCTTAAAAAAADTGAAAAATAVAGGRGAGRLTAALPAPTSAPVTACASLNTTATS